MSKNTTPQTSDKPVALVTGGAVRIGAAMVKALHAAGYRIIIHYHRSQTPAKEMKHALEALIPSSVALVSADLCDFKSLKPLIESATHTWGRLDVLINNASRYYPTPVDQASDAEWDDLMASNLMSPYFLSQNAYPYLKSTKGCIINMTDIKAVHPLKNYGIYCASKAGLDMVTRSMALAFAPDVRVNGVAPGSAILWPQHKAEMSETAKRKLTEVIPLKKRGCVDDITRTVLFLIESKHITGQIISVDGGQSL
jgi:pteridine reductase